MYRRSARSMHDSENLPENTETMPANVEPDARYRLYRCLFSRVPRQIQDLADRAYSALHDSILDLECDPHDCVDSAARPQWTCEQRPGRGGTDPAAAGMVAIFRILRRSRPRSPLHVFHGGADLQFDDPNRQAVDRSRLRC